MLFRAVLLMIAGLGVLDRCPVAAMHPTAGPTTAQMLVRAEVADSTRRLLALSTRYRDSAASERGAARRALRAAVIARRATLAALMETDPAGMLAVAMSEEERRALPPEIRSKVERDADVEGTLEVLHVDHPTDSRYLYSVRTARGRVALYPAAELPADATTGARVHANGKRIANALAVGGTTSSLQVMALPLANTIGAQSTAVLLVNFANAPTQPFSVADARSIVFTNASDFDREASYQQTWLAGDVFGWFTIPLASTTCDSSTLAIQARSAATAAGVDLAAFRRFVYVFPRNACSWAGLGTVGGNPSHAWLNGTLTMSIVAHEMGHNLGLYHSHTLDCSSGTCASVEYGDTLDVMGRSVSNHYGAFQKERLGWLGANASPPITTVQASGTYAIAPYETTGTAPKALKILKSTDATTGARTWYYVEVRRPLGLDSGIANSSNLTNGVIVRTGSEASNDSSFLLDMTPETTSFSDVALVTGRTFTDAVAGIAIKPTSVGTTGAVVAVTVGATACVRGPMAVALTPSIAQAAAGTESTLAVTVTSGDVGPCPASTVQLAPSTPPGWTALLSQATISVPASGAITTALSLTVPPDVAVGDYPIAVQAIPGNGAASVSATATLAIANGLDVRVSTDRATYPTSAYVFVTVLVQSAATPIAGAAVSVTITRPNGATIGRTLTTDASGAATTSVRLRRSAPGTYVVYAVATQGPALEGTGHTTFTVQ
jgi:hypothetical protein